MMTEEDVQRVTSDEESARRAARAARLQDRRDALAAQEVDDALRPEQAEQLLHESRGRTAWSGFSKGERIFVIACVIILIGLLAYYVRAR